MLQYIVLTSYFLILFLVFVPGLKYNLHMFQLNGYKKADHAKWLKNNAERQQFRRVFLFNSAVLFATGVTEYVCGNIHYAVSIAVPVLLSFTLLLVHFGYGFRIKTNTKKKLVYTARAKRIFGVTCGMYAFAIIVLTLISVNLSALFMTVLLYLLPYSLLLANAVLRPVENAITNRYINEAKRILKEHSGMTVIGITGSYGKTSLKFFLKEILSYKYNVCATPESYNTPMGVVRTIREHMKPADQIFLCEMGARRVGEIKEICDLVHPEHGIITAIGPQHLETFITQENVRRTKYELAEALPEGGKLILNGDSEEIRLDERPFNRIYYGIETKDGYVAKNISVSALGTDFTVTAPDGESEKFHTRLIGYTNVLNVLGAIACAHEFKMSLSEMVVPVRRIEPVRHRLELIDRGDITIIDDAFNSNPVGSKAAVETLKMFDGVRILITPGMVELGERHEELHCAFGTYAASCCDYILLTNSYRTKSIYKGAVDSGFPKEKLFEFDKFDEAMAFACKINEEGHKYILLENDLPDNY